MVSFRLGLPLFRKPALCTACGVTEMDIYGHHALKCHKIGDEIRRHDGVARAIKGFCTAGRFAPLTDPTGITHSRKRPGDVYIRSWNLGKPAAFDISITSPVQKTLVQRCGKEQGFAARRREEEKWKKHGAECAETNTAFYPIVIETFGRNHQASCSCSSGQQRIRSVCRGSSDVPKTITRTSSSTSRDDHQSLAIIDSNPKVSKK